MKRGLKLFSDASPSVGLSQTGRVSKLLSVFWQAGVENEHSVGNMSEKFVASAFASMEDQRWTVLAHVLLNKRG